MNIVLWILQILFAIYYVVGGVYMVMHYKLLASEWAVHTSLPLPVWITLGVIQVLFALGLVLPAIKGIPRKVTPISAVCLAVISLLGSVLYAAYSGSGILWAVVPAILLAFVAYGRRGWH